MRIQYASQMFRAAQRLPFHHLIKPVAPTLVLAGNCVQPWTREGKTFLRDAAISFDRVYIVPGPSEHSSQPQMCYRRNLAELNTQAYKRSNVFVLENRRYDMDTTHLIAGTTLWHHLNGVGTPVRDMVGINERIQMPDKQVILGAIHKRAVQNMFLEGRDFLRATMLDPENSTQRLVFATYHVPTFDALNATDKADYNTAIMSNNEAFYCEEPLRLWIAGAGTGAGDAFAGSVRIVKNAHGDGEIAAPTFSLTATIGI
jgi:hypothetical protein